MEQPVNYSEFKEIKGAVEHLLGKWESVKTKVETNRKIRYADIDDKQARQEGKLLEDESYIPVRVANTNIDRENAACIQYIVSSRRAAIFECIQNSSEVVEDVEKAFTKACRYSGWQLPYFQLLDSSKQNGWACLEVAYDSDKPGKFVTEYIAHEDLAFPDDTEDLQSCRFILRLYRLTKMQLRNFPGMDQKQVDKLIGQNESRSNRDEDRVEKVYKIFFKQDGYVYCAWGAKGCDDWLVLPKVLHIGIAEWKTDPTTGQQVMVDRNETDYPIFRLPYHVSENQKIFETHGRVFFDSPVQQASSSIMTSVTAGIRRSTIPIYTRGDETPWNADILQTDMKVAQGSVFDKKLDVNFVPSPPMQAVNLVQQLAVMNQQETNQPNYAVLNRKDSEKTATEIQAAQSTSAQMGSVQVALLGVLMRDVLTLCWMIFKTAVIQEQVKTDVPMYKFTDYTYNLKPAGDQDVIERQEKLRMTLQIAQAVAPVMPVLVQPLVKLILQLAFPSESQTLLQEMESSNRTNQMLQMLMNIINTMAVNPETGQIDRIDPNNLQVLNNEANRILSGASGVRGPGPAAATNQNRSRPATPGLASPSLYNPTPGPGGEPIPTAPPLG